MNIPFEASDRLPDTTFREIRLRTIFECFKWDPQVEDSSVLAPFIIRLKTEAWRELSALAENLAAETIAAESEILASADLLALLKLPRKIEKAVSRESKISAAPRVMRFDFHFTTEGWRISEVNSDVPGGFVEAQGFTQLMAEAFGLGPTGFPARAVAEALIRSATASNPNIALVHASAYSDDRQVMLYLGREIEKQGGRAILLDPSQVDWNGDTVQAHCDWFDGPLHAIYRFFPAEWLPNLRRTCGWENFFRASCIPQCNPGTALASQSKRFGLVCANLRNIAPTWSAFLPETRDVRGMDSRSREWVFKPALGRVGDGIGLQGSTSEKEWREIRRDMFFYPSAWVAQRKFEMLPLPTPSGSQFVCLGVYTVDGAAAGIYGRCSPSRIINHSARDVAVLVEKELS